MGEARGWTTNTAFVTNDVPDCLVLTIIRVTNDNKIVPGLFNRPSEGVAS